MLRCVCIVAIECVLGLKWNSTPVRSLAQFFNSWVSDESARWLGRVCGACHQCNSAGECSVIMQCKARWLSRKKTRIRASKGTECRLAAGWNLKSSSGQTSVCVVAPCLLSRQNVLARQQHRPTIGHESRAEDTQNAQTVSTFTWPSNSIKTFGSF